MGLTFTGRTYHLLKLDLARVVVYQGISIELYDISYLDSHPYDAKELI